MTIYSLLTAMYSLYYNGSIVIYDVFIYDGYIIFVCMVITAICYDKSKMKNIILSIFHILTEMKLTLVVLLLGLVTVSALDLTEIKLSFCNKLKNHWAYDRLRLKKNCLEMAKEIGSQLCVDVIKIVLSFALILVTMS